jgi:hypothetical protein
MAEDQLDDLDRHADLRPCDEPTLMRDMRTANPASGTRQRFPGRTETTTSWIARVTAAA